MKKVYLEHANISVINFEKTLDFLKSAFPSFNIRGGDGEGSERWLHFGDDHTYIALSAGVADPVSKGPNYQQAGFNHLGFVVDDITSLSQRLLEKGFKKNYPDQNEKYRTRHYFVDAEGNEYEFVQYLSQNIKEQNLYTRIV